MLMEYLGPVVDGCRAALNVSIDKAQEFSKLSEEYFDQHISSVMDSFRNLTICMKVTDIDEEYSIVFNKGKTSVYNECIEPDVVISSDHDTLLALFNNDPKLSPPEVLGTRDHRFFPSRALCQSRRAPGLSQWLQAPHSEDSCGSSTVKCTPGSRGTVPHRAIWALSTQREGAGVSLAGVISTRSLYPQGRKDHPKALWDQLLQVLSVKVV